MKQVTGFAPASVGNVACGFDVLGFALTEPGDEVTVSFTDDENSPAQVIISKIIGDGGALPTDPYKNTASIVVIKFLEFLKTHKGIEQSGTFSIELKKNLPLSSGMGSSASSAAAALIAANSLLGSPCTKMELVPFVMEGERIACGSIHADNAAPAMLGNFILTRSYDPLDLIPISTPPELYCSLVHPHIEVPTSHARSILKKEIALSSAVRQWGNVGALVAGLLRCDYELIGRALEDVVAEPVRAPLIPGFYDVKHAALDAGALGGSIAGSGPSIFAFSDSLAKAETIAKAMQETFRKVSNLESDIWFCPVSREGSRIL
ncbi:homoserine kinase [Chloroherpeton thalassium ATCC 35110]|uniref:Homoserine kinase n=1 Tax=Chloroherpeton thalassium (strain ATCC 35110 / GB-78) TaxID=517418 RepID=KHSE_CHLT3|nr:homoserine kinase [Chloroherpeton thalassium]B3QWX6.1 RecName: Full=Homoserine kinase; Short=HK; Short=HSK [Chloroherpeton thalassium ATCC 35110]ACF13340.1 homoserine kinase [Chloroherpeton thalassium ATCC 35110]